MSRQLKEGDKAIVQLKVSEVYEGDVLFLTDTQITLTNVYFRTKHCSIKDNLVFYKAEIESIQVFKDKKQKDSNIKVNGFGVAKHISIAEEEFYRLKDMGLNYIYLSAFDKEFGRAVNDLSNCESVGVVGLGSTFKNSRPLSVLLMCSFQQVYIFDVQILIKLDRLKEIFESEYITKVVHDGTALFDVLFHKYNITMANVFDTQVADSMLSKQDEGVEVCRDISQCLLHRFNFPATLLAASMEHFEDQHWIARPLSKSQNIIAGQLVIYLLSLRDHLNRLLLKEFFDNVEKKYYPYKTTDSYDFLNQTKILSLNSH